MKARPPPPPAGARDDGDPLVALVAPAVLAAARPTAVAVEVEEVAAWLERAVASGAVAVSYPAAAAALNAIMATGDDCNAAVRLCSREPLVVAALLWNANGAALGRGRPVTELRDAIMRLGMRDTRQIAMAVLSSSMFEAGAGGDRALAATLGRARRQALIAAFSAVWLELQGDAVHEATFVAAMFVHIGKAVALHAAHRLQAIATVDPAVIAAAVEQVQVELGVATQTAWRLPPRSIEVCRRQRELGPAGDLRELDLVRTVVPLVALRTATGPEPALIETAQVGLAALGIDRHRLRALATAIDEQAALVARMVGGSDPPTWRAR